MKTTPFAVAGRWRAIAMPATATSPAGCQDSSAFAIVLGGRWAVATAPALQLAIQAALLQWLGDRIVVDAVEVDSVDSTLTVKVRYLVRRNQQRQIVELTRRV